jgi:dTDP-4-amino-4,6-dideoxygalactose transaminase
VVYNFGANAYGKPATGLNILRETIMGHELFDHAFKTYANRWKFKHPTPEDFFRTMEDASAVDLDWFWKGWFYSTDVVDLGIKNVKQFYVTEDATKENAASVNRRGRRMPNSGPMIYLVNSESSELKPESKTALETEKVMALNDYLNKNYSAEEKAALKNPKDFYEVEFDKPGSLMMPIIAELQFEDGTSETHKFPVQIWRRNNITAKRVFATEKKVVKIQLDPKLETADIDVTNNTWPKEAVVDKFEQMVADYAGVKYGIATMNGTAGLHIALVLAGVKPNDYVIVSNMTFVASANSIKYAGADPILIDADPHTWQMDLDLLDEFLDTKTSINIAGERFLKSDGRCVRTIMPVHIQGNIFDVKRFKTICEKYNISFVEDAAEALGSKYKGQSAGTFETLGVFSFNGNKIISTGGGGVIVTNDPVLAKKAKHLTTTAKVDPMLYYHDEVGYNYRLVNILAAIGVAQMEQLPSFVKKKQYIGDYYRENLLGVGDIEFQYVIDEVEHNEWLFTIKTNSQKGLLKYLNANGVMSRPFWMPMNQLPMYENCQYISKIDNCRKIHDSCLSIPCSTGITEEDLKKVVKTIKNFYKVCI